MKPSNTQTHNCLLREISAETKSRILRTQFDTTERYGDQITIRLAMVEKVLDGLFKIAALCDNEESENILSTDFLFGLSGLLTTEVRIVKILVKGATSEKIENING